MIKKIILALGILIVVVVITSTIVWYMLGRIFCGDDQFENYQSPNEKHQVVSYRRNCGATTTYVYNVELDGKNILRYTYGEPVVVKWVDDKNVSVSMASSSPYMRIYKILDDCKNIKIYFDQNIKDGHSSY